MPGGHGSRELLLHEDKRAVWSWALFDFANSPFTTLVVTFVYATYFTQAIVTDAVDGTVLWSRGITITAVVVALCSPVLGALADRGGLRKRFLIASTLVAIVSTALLYGIVPGQVMTALAVFVVANIAYEFATVFYNAFLPDLTTARNIGRVSGWGWGLGYLGGLLALAVALVTLVQPEVPWFGFTTENGENVRATNLLVAAWFLVFSLPMLLFVHDDRSGRSPRAAVVRDAVAQLGSTFRQIRKHRETVKFLVARLVYNDGLVTIFAFGGIYAAGTFGFTLADVLVFGIVINFAAGIGAIAMGYLDDFIGAKRTIVISLLGLILASVIGILAQDAAWFWVAGILIGIFSGPNQSASRSLMGRYVPPGMHNEFFGFFAFSGKLTAFIGPLFLGIVTDLADSQRIGMTVVLAMFVVGLLLLTVVREPDSRSSLE
jgi:UMF1 family MFS transporter